MASFTINPPNAAMVDGRGIVTPVWYRFFANLQRVLGNDIVSAIQNSPIVTWNTSSALTNERVLSAGRALTATISDATLTIDLDDTAVTPGDYGSAIQTVAFSVDRSGRIIAATEYDLETGNVEETSNLYFTEERARDAITSGDGIDYDPSTGVISVEATLAALNGLNATPGLLEQTGPATFTKRALGVAASTSVPTRSDADARYIMVSSSVVAKARAVTATTSIAADDFTILADATSGAIVVNLPSATTSAGRILIVKKTDASVNAVTITPTGGQLVDNAASRAITITLEAVRIQAQGGNWWLI